MSFGEMSCHDFINVLATKQPVPGGGGASALIGAIGMALGNMVGSLTVGKKKYADVEQDIIELKQKADKIQLQLLDLMERDAEVFEPLSRAYAMPKETEEQKIEKAKVMEKCLIAACSVPMDIMKVCCESILLQEEFAKKGAAIAISDVGVGVACCKAALMGASLNVFINTNAMTDNTYAKYINDSAQSMLEVYTKKADEIYNCVLERLLKKI